MGFCGEKCDLNFFYYRKNCKQQPVNPYPPKLKVNWQLKIKKEKLERERDEVIFFVVVVLIAAKPPIKFCL